MLPKPVDASSCEDMGAIVENCKTGSSAAVPPLIGVTGSGQGRDKSPSESTVIQTPCTSSSPSEDPIDASHAFTQKKVNAEVDNDPQVEDSAYSWVVSAGAAVQFAMVGGLYRSFGLVLAALEQQRGFTSSQVAVIPALFLSLCFLTAPLCGALCRRFSERAVCLGGTSLTMLGLVLSGFTTDIYILYLTNGIIFGVGQSLATIPGTLIVTKYFVKRRAVACSINATSSAIGGVFFAPLVEAMLEEYGLPGTYMIMGGLQFQACVSAMLYRPLETHRKILRLERRRELRQKGSLPSQCQDIAEELEKSRLAEEAPYSDRLPSGQRGDSEKKCTSPILDGTTLHRRPSATLTSSSVTPSRPSLAVETPAVPRSVGCWQQVLRSLDLRLLTDPLYLACVTSIFLFTAGLPHVCLLVPRFGLEIGVSRSQTANMIAIITPIDIIGRLLFGFLLDRNLFHKRYGLFITCAFGGVGVLALVFVHSYAALFASCTAVYTAVGFFLVVPPVMYAEYYGAERLSSTLTMSNLFAGVANLTAQPLAGLLRDAAGTFRTVFAVLAAGMLAGGSLVLLHPCIKRAGGGQGRENKPPEVLPRVCNSQGGREEAGKAP